MSTVFSFSLTIVMNLFFFRFEFRNSYIAFINSILIVMAQVQDINTLAAQVQGF
jgi:hypothetical protein